MIKFVPLESVHNFIPSVVKGNTPPIQINSWALQCYRTVAFTGAKDYEIVPIKIINHNARLPDDVQLVHDVFYTPKDFSEVSTLFAKEIGSGDVDFNKVLIYQKIFYSSVSELGTFARLAYKGQHRAKIIDQGLYCDSCEMGFSLDKTMTCMTIDIKDGTLGLLYSRPVKDGDSFLIPDDARLQKGLAEFVNAQFWQDRMYAHEQNAAQFYNEACMRCENLIKAFQSDMIARKLDIEAHQQLLNARNNFDYRK